jgi:hypothetical protein
MPAQHQITVIDAQIDRLVYDIYVLTEDKISIVEGAGRGASAVSR